MASSDQIDPQLYRPIPHTVLAVLWDGSQSEAGLIIEWVERMEGSMKYFETNEGGPKLVAYNDNGITEDILPEQWVIWGRHHNFFGVDDNDFEEIYERILPPPG